MTYGQLFVEMNPDVKVAKNGTCVWIFLDEINHDTIRTDWWNKEIPDDLLKTQESVRPHRNYQYLSDYWCECGWHLGKAKSVKFCSECGRMVDWYG